MNYAVVHCNIYLQYICTYTTVYKVNNTILAIAFIDRLCRVEDSCSKNFSTGEVIHGSCVTSAYTHPTVITPM